VTLGTLISDPETWVFWFFLNPDKMEWELEGEKSQYLICGVVL
jgi:hypothetical protein